MAPGHTTTMHSVNTHLKTLNTHLKTLLSMTFNLSIYKNGLKVGAGFALDAFSELGFSKTSFKDLDLNDGSLGNLDRNQTSSNTQTAQNRDCHEFGH